MTFLLLTGAAASGLFMLAWWSSGRAAGRAPIPAAQAEIARGAATNQALLNRDQMGGWSF
jgi:hypothetical protein